jgi:hypothetical protein
VREAFAILFTGLFGVVPAVLSTAPADASVWWLQYSDRSTGQCMEVAAGAQDGASVTQNPCRTPIGTGADHQLFQLALLGDGNYRLIVQSSNKCIRILGDFTGDAEGAPLEQFTCLGAATEEWQTPTVRVNPNGSSDIMFRNVATGKCIASDDGTFFPPFLLRVRTCSSANTRQVWHQHLREGGGNASS